VGPEHVGALIALFESNAGSAVTSSFDPFPLTEQEGRRIALEPRRDLYYVAVRADRLVGMSMLRGFDEGYAIPSFGIFVDYRANGQGVGRALTSWTIEAARRCGCKAVRLSVYASNTVARGLYTSLGFSELERSSVDRDGKTEEKIIMSLSLAC
jgi:ribosomal protein S18 acetylase RimI-like enzyme